METEVQHIRQFFTNKIWRLQSFSRIAEIKLSEFKISNTSFGEKTGKFTQTNYVDRYKECLAKENYQILLQDESLISFYYEYENENITKYSLSFIPSPDSDIEINSYEGYDSINDKERILLLPCYLDYLRLDYDSLGYKHLIHEKQHLHKGIYGRDTSKLERREFRFPFENVLYPEDFVFIILKYVYHLEDELSEYLELGKTEARRRLLDDDQFLTINYKN